MRFFGRSESAPKLSRRESLSARPALNQLVSMERNARGMLVLNLPRRRTAMVRAVARAFKLPPYKRVELDELGSYTVELCDGTHSVSEIIGLFAEKFRLSRREAEVSMVSYLEILAKRGVISFVLGSEK